MDPDPGRRTATPVTFIVRLFPDDDARVTGIVERVRTGEKERFYGVGAIGPLIAQMLSGICVFTITTGRTLTTPTGAAMSTGIPNLAVGDSFDFTVITEIGRAHV